VTLPKLVQPARNPRKLAQPGFRRLPLKPKVEGSIPSRPIKRADGPALTKRYKASLERANLRPLRFHDPRHTFGTRMITQADIRRVQPWMGHADVQTTMRYLHYVPRAARRTRVRGAAG
jgi:integrase